jgi:hypothetical protein
VFLNTNYSYGYIPNDPKEGDVYYNTKKGKHYVYTNGDWEKIKDHDMIKRRILKIKAILK